MNRSDVLLLGCGGAGNKLLDTILSVDERFVGYFVNSSITDIQSLTHYDGVDRNYICISQNNGAGRNRELGKRYAEKFKSTIFDTLQRFDQKTIFLIASLGGGSGSSIVSVLLDFITEMRENGGFEDKTVNLIGILPDLNSPDIILSNTLDTWNEIISHQYPKKDDSPEEKANFKPCINNMMFIDNNNKLYSRNLSENEINQTFAELFDSIFDIPELNGTKFDNANLGNIINSQGCTYIFDLPNGRNSFEIAMAEAEQNTVFAKMMKPKELLRMDNGFEKTQCGYLGVSFNSENYSNDDVLQKYYYTEENYHGYNDEKNLLLISGMLPPLYSLQVIEAKLEERKNENVAVFNDYSQFTVKKSNSGNNTSTSTVKSNPQNKPKNNMQKSKLLKKVMKKNLLDSI